MTDISEVLQSAIEATEKNPVIKWNDPGWSIFVNEDNEFSTYMNNELIFLNSEQVRCHGYFALLHNIVSRLSDNASICELGNREGLSTLAILDAMRSSQSFVTIDTVVDLRFIPGDMGNQRQDEGSFLAIHGDCLHPDVIDAVDSFIKTKISLLFCDTIHVYEQVQKEFEVYEPLLADEAIILVDDIQDERSHSNPQYHRTKYRFYEEWEGEKHDLTVLCHNPSGFGAFIYRRQK